MPTEVELDALYKTGAGYHNMTPLLKTTGWYVWGIKSDGSSVAWLFNFLNGRRYWGYRDYSASFSGFCGALPGRWKI
jgi:hypothetical protein